MPGEITRHARVWLRPGGRLLPEPIRVLSSLNGFRDEEQGRMGTGLGVMDVIELDVAVAGPGITGGKPAGWPGCGELLMEEGSETDESSDPDAEGDGDDDVADDDGVTITDPAEPGGTEEADEFDDFDDDDFDDEFDDDFEEELDEDYDVNEDNFGDDFDTNGVDFPGDDSFEQPGEKSK